MILILIIASGNKNVINLNIFTNQPLKKIIV